MTSLLKMLTASKYTAVIAIALSTIVLLSVNQSCSIEEPDKNPNKGNNFILDHDSAYKVTYQHLSYSDGQYSLLLSREAAKELGVSDTIYDEMLTYLDNANKMVKEMINNDSGIQFFDPQSMSQNSIPLTRSGGEGDGGGRVNWDDPYARGNMPNQEPVWVNVTIPPGYTNVRVVVYSAALIGIGNVTLTTPFGSQDDWTCNFLFWGGKAVFSLPLSSGMSGTVKINVGSDQGGTYSISFGKK